MTDRELMQQALVALEKIASYRPLTFAECSDAEAVMGIAEKAIPALREALAEQPAQQVVDSDEKAGAYMDARLWEFIDMAAAWPKASPDPRTWNHVVVYAPKPAQQEPAAVVSGYYGGQCVILPIDPARIFNSNTVLYTTPPPCPTCEALARTVMLDQTSHDAQRKPLPLRERTRIVRANKMRHDSDEIDAYGVIDDVEASHGIGEKNG